MTIAVLGAFLCGVIAGVIGMCMVVAAKESDE
jgi:hypothetical protein